MAHYLVLVLVALLGLGLALAVAVGLSAALRAPSGPPGAVDVAHAPDAYRRARRHAGLVAVLAWAAMLVVTLTAPALAAPGPHQGLLLGAVPAAAGLAFLLVAAVGERTWPRQDGSLRRAPLRPRRVRDLAPPALRRLAWAWVVALAGTALVLGLTAAPDGRTVALRLSADATATSGPYPGWAYGLPLTAAALLVLLAGEGVLRLVAARPVVAAVSEEDDVRLRSVSARRVLAGVQLVLGGALAGVLGVAGAALRLVAQQRPTVVDGVETWHGVPAVAAVGTALVLTGTAVGLVALVVGAISLHRAARDAAAPVVPLPTAP